MTNTTSSNATQLWVLGRLAVYAPTLQVARQAYELLGRRAEHEAFGTVTLASGDEVDWVDMNCQVILAPEKQCAD